MATMGVIVTVPMKLLLLLMALVVHSESANTNNVYQPCADTKIQRSDGFTFGIAFSSRDSFFSNQSHQLSPCDRRLSLAALNSQLAVFRPRVDQISLLSINTSSFFPVLTRSWFYVSDYFEYSYRSLQFLICFFLPFIEVGRIRLCSLFSRGFNLWVCF